MIPRNSNSKKKNVRLAYLTRHRASKEEFTPKNKTKEKKKARDKTKRDLFPIKKNMDLATLRYIMMRKYKA